MPHSRRKSGGYVSATSSDGNRKTVVASDFTRTVRTSVPRRYTPTSSTSSSSQKISKMAKPKAEVYDDEAESFPQFCMTCEKQFVPIDDKFLYCSESCRHSDQSSTSSASSSTLTLGLYGSHDHSEFHYHEPARDIIPQASPSRPTSTLFASSPSSYDEYHSHHESAVEALRYSLNNMAVRPPSPVSPTSGSIWPFRRASAAPSVSSNEDSYHKPGYMTSATFDPGYYHYNGAAERPLPTRQPYGYSRSKSTELVTPILTR
ncbi:hypothetical protein VHEMI05220 [[Torrubiella] hemipterigena]|uniref:Life-span regulatory factor domain-containing protein n=1 Tax=[Torrubiella] hemipterigena TaxID=1531966 RepID=A0A0A1TG30_9HYPO|nr:hypothetical protein VHEMI05220 [[Torrubiella] hemipterigena]